jgi:hypothetical protein
MFRVASKVRQEVVNGESHWLSHAAKQMNRMTRFASDVPQLVALGYRFAHEHLVVLVAIGLGLFFVAPLHAGPLITAGTNLRNEIVTTGELLGQAGIVIGFLGLMFENVRSNHMGALMWLVIGGAGVWGSAALINTVIL